MRKNVKNLLIMILAIIPVALFAVACNGGKNPPKGPAFNGIELSEYAYTMDLFDDYTVTAETNADQSEIVWASSNESVATVDGGKITPIAVGTTEITATVKGETATLYLTVVNNSDLPVLELNVQSLRLLATDEYPLNASLKYKGEPVEDAQFSYETTNPSVATVTDDGVVTAIASGVAEIKVVANWKNVSVEYVTQYVGIQVVRNVSFKYNKDAVAIYAIAILDGVTYPTTDVVTCDVYEDDTPMTGQTVTFESSDEDVFTVSQSGEIVGKKAGKGLLNVKAVIDGIEYADSMSVDIKRPIIENNDKLYIGRTSTHLDYIFGDTVKIVSLDAEAASGTVNIEVEDGNVCKKLTLLETGKTSITVNNELYSCKFTNVEVVDLYITHTDEVLALRLATDVNAVLGKDIDMKGVALTSNDGVAFTGTFDGNGYSISNLTYNGRNVSLFNSLRGTVKNLALNAVSVNEGNTQVGAVSMYLDGGTIDNVYVSISMAGGGLSAGFTQQVRKPSTISNSVVQVTSAAMNPQSGLMVGRGYDTLTLTNTYAIKPAGCDKKLVGTYGDAGSSWANFRDTVNSLDTTANPISYYMEGFFDAVYAENISVNTALLAKAGIKDSRIVVSTADELVAAFKEATQNEKRYASIVLTADIDMSKQTGGNKALSPIAVFSGTFDGKGHSISNLILKYGGGNGTGMFTQLNEGTVKNVALLNVSYDSTIDTSKNYTATIAGGIRGATVDNVYVSVDVSGAGNYSAGIAGWVNSSSAGLKITNCVVAITTNAGDATQGGLIGKGSLASPADFSGSYIVTETTTLNAMGDVGSVSITANESGKYALANFKTANIDFSGYNKAVSENVAKLIAE